MNQWVLVNFDLLFMLGISITYFHYFPLKVQQNRNFLSNNPIAINWNHLFNIIMSFPSTESFDSQSFFQTRQDSACPSQSAPNTSPSRKRGFPEDDIQENSNSHYHTGNSFFEPTGSVSLDCREKRHISVPLQSHIEGMKKT